MDGIYLHPSMQNRWLLVALLDGQQMHEAAFNFRVIAELDFADGPFLLGYSLWLDLRLRNPHAAFRFQRQRANIYRIGRSADASILVENGIHLQQLIWPKRPCFHDREYKIGLQDQRR